MPELTRYAAQDPLQGLLRKVVVKPYTLAQITAARRELTG